MTLISVNSTQPRRLTAHPSLAVSGRRSRRTLPGNVREVHWHFRPAQALSASPPAPGLSWPHHAGRGLRSSDAADADVAGAGGVVALTGSDGEPGGTPVVAAVTASGTQGPPPAVESAPAV